MFTYLLFFFNLLSSVATGYIRERVLDKTYTHTDCTCSVYCIVYNIGNDMHFAIVFPNETHYRGWIYTSIRRRGTSLWYGTVKIKSLTTTFPFTQ